MAAEPVVSVVIPTRDRPELVAGAVRSALRQEGARAEVCVVDDGSAQPLALPADLVADERVALIRIESGSGAATARNAGLAGTGADLVAFLDDDDVWLPGKLARQLDALRAGGPGTVMVACGFEAWEGERLVAAVLPPADVNSGALLAHPCIWPSTVLARRSALAEAGGFDESLTRVEDWDLWLRIADLGTIATLPEVLVDRRWAPLAPHLAQAARAQIVPRIEARLDRLPRRDATRLRAARRCDDGVVLARLGRRREAAALLMDAWRADPRSRRAALGLARAVIGERAWRAAAALAAPARDRLRRRPPRPPGPAPGWAGR
jgi:glycosyltransferase involved in cell wall biosynthesis